MFKPAADQSEMESFKKSLGFTKDDFVVLYTGRFTNGKNPLLLARAIDKLQKSGYHTIKGLYVGSGDQKAEIQSCIASTMVEFVPYFELYKYYQIADIGVWPAQESTSMLDAAATGIPIIVNNTIHAKERYEGNGLTYELGNVDDLASKILKLFTDTALRKSLGMEGQLKMSQIYSWDRIAKEREDDYSADMNS